MGAQISNQPRAVEITDVSRESATAAPLASADPPHTPTTRAASLRELNTGSQLPREQERHRAEAERILAGLKSLDQLLGDSATAQDVIAKLDKNGDGLLEKREIGPVLERMGLSLIERQVAYSALDKVGKGELWETLGIGQEVAQSLNETLRSLGLIKDDGKLSPHELAQCLAIVGLYGDGLLSSKPHELTNPAAKMTQHIINENRELAEKLSARIKEICTKTSKQLVVEMLAAMPTPE